MYFTKFLQSQTDVHNFFTIFFREAVDFRFSPQVPSGCLLRRSTARSTWATAGFPCGAVRTSAYQFCWSGSGPLRVLNIIFNKENYISFLSPPRDRALVFSARAPFAFVPEIPKMANKNAGGAEGGFQGGIPPRPPLVVCDDAISGDSALSAKLLRDLDSNQDNSLQRAVSYH